MIIVSIQSTFLNTLFYLALTLKIILQKRLDIKKEILNSFTWINDRRVSNGPCEGKNNYVKKILSNANGMSNFQRARNRILYSQNKYETYTMNEHTDRIKRIGNPRGSYKKNTK